MAMKLTVVGSADAMNSCGRGNSCYLLEGDGDGQLMVDFGPTALAMLKRLRVDLRALGGLVFTHLHGDHTGGFPLLCIETMFGRSRAAELDVLGPPLSVQTLGEVFRAAYAELEGELHERMRLSIEELAPGHERGLAGYTVRAFAADHMAPPHQALCLRITDRSGRIVAFSGDSRICPGLLEAAAGADLLVADCSRVAPPAGAHATWQEWVATLPALRAKALLLTHLGEDMRTRGPGLLAERDWPLPIRLADDGMVIEL
jgi:ribonuclease BN (tRNA processing enzyme)